MSKSKEAGNREFDLVVFGATSFVGKILCNYLVNEYAEPNFSWAMAARSQAKLDELKSSLGNKAASIPAFTADSADQQSLDALCQRASVIISTVGPYALYGEKLVKACAESGTDYCDLTGEAHWIRRMLLRYEKTAQSSGARIVNCCGFDSIPSDLGVKFLQQETFKRSGRYCEKVRMGVKASKGGASGGTIASGINLYKEASRNAELRREMRDYYSICPPDHGMTARQKTVSFEYDPDFKSWAGPFIMAAINTRVVLRSNALSGNAYGADFSYSECSLTGDGKKGRKRAKRLKSGSGLAGVVLAVAPLRWLAMRFLPKPGEGPSPEQQLNGFYDLRFSGRTAQGDLIQVKVYGDRDPGYGSTAKMLAQAAISLQRDVDRSKTGGGFMTPATVFGDSYIDRLQSHAGMEFKVLAWEPAKQA